MKLLSRTDAKKQGLTRYYTGKPCVRGHVEERLVSNGRCAKCLSMCTAARIKERYHTDPAFRNKYITQAKARHEREGNTWYWSNIDRAAETNKRWIANHKESHLLTKATWRINNRDRLSFLQARRRARQLQATPLWARQEAIQRFYTEANRLTQETGVAYTVDHVVPLNNELVCGLHVEYNLQVITLIENSSKGNKHEE